MIANFEDLSDQSKLWIYPADRFIESTECAQIREELSNFLNDWNAHGSPILNFGEIYHNKFLVIFADETKSYASGCSIDKSVNFIEKLGHEFGIDWFNRLQIQYIQDEKITTIHGISQLKELIKKRDITEETMIFDNTVKDKSQFKNEWIKPIKNSWLKRYFNS